MIRAIRPSAMAHDDAALVGGWNIAPNVAYTLLLLPGAVSCGVFLFAEDGATLVASGAALAGTDQPCVLIPQTGQTVDMVDADLGWHLLLTTVGTESQREIRIGPAVDLPDEIHPVYGDDSMALARATAAIDAAAHYVDDITVTCPRGLGDGLGDVASVPVDGEAVVGQVESVTWIASPDGTSETVVIRRHVAIAPEAFAEPIPPTVADDGGTATHLVGTSGNVLTNDEAGLTVTAVNGLSANVGVTVDGDNGGSFTIAADGAWTFDPDGDFALLSGSETADTSVTYHASDGTAEAMATLTVTVSYQNTAPVAVDDVGATTANATTSGDVLTNDTDADADSLTVSRVAGSADNVGVAVAGSSGGLFTVASNGAWTFDPDGDFDSLTGAQTATTSVGYHVSDGIAEDDGLLTVTVSPASGTLWTPADISGAVWVDADTATLDGAAIAALTDKVGGIITASQSTSSARPTLVNAGLNGKDVIQFDGADFLSFGTTLGKPANWTMFVVAMSTNVAGGGFVGSAPPPSNTVHCWSGIEMTGGKNRYRYGDGSAYRYGDTTDVVYANNDWFCACLTFADGGPTPLLHVNGAYRAAGTTAGTATTCGGTPYKMSLGRIGEYNIFAPAGSRMLGAVIVPGTSLDTDTRQKLEGYYMHRAGLTALLPSDHPYKSAPPTI